MSAIFTIGQSIETGLPVHVRYAKNGLSSNCICYECSERLEAVQGKRDWYFRHSNKSNCLGSVETALHQLAKLLLYENYSIATSKRIVDYTDPCFETVIDKYRSDVSAKYGNAELHFEVVVHNDLEPHKKKYYQSNKINCIKIDLSDPELLTAKPEQIRYAVIQDKLNKEFIQWNEDEGTYQTTNHRMTSNEAIVSSAFILVVGYIIKKFLFNPSKSKRNRRQKLQK